MKKEIFDFSEALRRMKEGKKVKRCGWNSSDSYSIGKDRWGREHVYITEKPHETIVDMSCGNILATDWEEVEKMSKKILTLTISKQWFDMIADGRKTEEYREIKPYWVKRIIDVSKLYRGVAYILRCLKYNDPMLKNDIIFQLGIPYTHVLFINGYRKDSPRIEKEIESITIGKPKKGLCPDKWLDTEFFIIKFK